MSKRICCRERPVNRAVLCRADPFRLPGIALSFSHVSHVDGHTLFMLIYKFPVISARVAPFHENRFMSYEGHKTQGGLAMPSNTKITELKRKRKKSNLGKARKKAQSKQSTPAFSVHVEKDV